MVEGKLKFLPLLLAAMAFLWPSIAHAELKYYYCFTPDVATDTVYLSPAMPVGPIPERSKYGTKFSEYLKAQGLTTDLVQTYCVMRETAEQVDQAQRALAEETCIECGGISHFQHVIMGGKGSNTLVKRPLPRPTPPHDPTKGHVASPFRPPLIVIMGNDISGDILFAVGGDDPKFEAREKAQKAGGEWEEVFVGYKPYAAIAMACATEGEGEAQRVRFYVGEAEDMRVALADANDRADLAASANGTEAFKCGKMMKVGADYEPKQERQFSIIDWIKGMIRKQVTKEYGCPSENKDEAKSQPESCPKFIKTSNACMCVRG